MTKGAILYVEDNYENRTLVRHALEADDFAVLEAANASQALEKIHAEQPVGLHD